ncbi:DnaJ C-terminal domain-containing protein [Alloalcanivorax sp. C16-2]|uniref:DnaJ C-terminal domain-containing protein n=1 Tax=Alloalcanivorax TaxID=3020832 RepID=UPI001932FFF2|nr:DnaJ C-terminal domain-containing protein [Alloalcanivorax marinus]MBL7249697.1 DnaJ domain-containing protein [Alloalcanivorax marinus]
MEFKDYYDILGIKPDADDKAIKGAYRKLARKYHPDVSSDDDAESKFKAVSEAYHVLKDPEKRAEYDQLRRYRQSGGGQAGPDGWQGFRQGGGEAHFDDAGAFSDFFQSIFGGGGGFSQRGGPRAGRDLEVELPLFLEDTVADTRKQIRVGDRTLNVTVPAGTGDNERIRLKGQGAPGLDGGPAGDLYLRVRLVPHPLFDVDGHDLLVTVPVAPWEAVLGAKVSVPTLSGRISLTVPANSQNGRRLRIKGKGLVGQRHTGDLYAVLKVVLPEHQDEESLALWRQLADRAGFDPRADWEKRA